MGKKNPVSFQKLLEKISLALIEYLKMQAKCGVDALQIFDSWHNLCPPDHLWDYSLRWIAQIIENVPKDLSLIIYANCTVDGLSEIVRKGTVPWEFITKPTLSKPEIFILALWYFRATLTLKFMETHADHVVMETTKILDSMKNDPAHILNLGSWNRPNAKIECMEALGFYRSFLQGL
jgi:uroporphyrinogen decarboxylase